MRKIMAITMLLVTLLASTCFAADWYWLLSTDTTSFYVDRSSGQWNGSLLNCTIKGIDSQNDYYLVDNTFDYSRFPRIYKRWNYFWSYNADGTFKGSSRSYEWEPVAPESVGEAIAVKIYYLFAGRRN